MKKYMYVPLVAIIIILSGGLVYNYQQPFKNYSLFLDKTIETNKPSGDALPATMPPDFAFEYYRGGGMTQRFIKISFGVTKLKIQESDDRGKETVKEKTLTLEIRQKTYQVLRGLNLEKIQVVINKEPEYDGESTSFAITTKQNQDTPDIKIQFGGSYEMTPDSIPIYKKLIPLIDEIKKTM